MLIVIDANELFASIIKRNRTLNLFFDSRIELVSPEFILNEFMDHKREIIKKSGLNEKDIVAFLLMLKPKIKFFKTEDFEEFLSLAEEISPDKDDAEYLALALKLNCPVWSEDKKLKNQEKVRIYSTSELLKMFEYKFQHQL